MATKRITSVETKWFFSTTSRNYSRKQDGWNGDHRSDYTYTGHEATAVGTQRNTVNNSYVGIDAPNTKSLSLFQSFGGVPPASQPAYNACYAKLREDALGETSQVGTAITEWRKSLDMVHNRAIGLGKAALALRKGKFKAFLKALRTPAKKKHKGKLRNTAAESSGLWLEYWFGWSASIGDIASAVKALGGPLPYGTATGATSSPYVKDSVSSRIRYVEKHTIKHRMQLDVLLSNPNYFMANQLGLINVPAIIWERIPFSFLVDWVGDVQSFIESFTDYIGVETARPVSTHILEFQDTQQWTQAYMTPGIQACSGTAMIRKLVITRPIPNTQVTANLGQRLTRTASAVSLLTQTLLSMRR